MTIEHGNLDELNQQFPERKGWTVGDFIEKESLRNSGSLEIKWAHHKKGLKKSAGSELEKNIRSLVILLSGKWRQFYPESNQEIILSKSGDFVVYTGQPHESEALEDTHVIVVRWKEV